VSKAGKFLIARPQLTQGFFARSVVYVYEDSVNGTAGLVVNKSTSGDFADIVLDRGYEISRGVIPIYAGGPVNIRAITMLHTDEWYSQNTMFTGTGLNLSSDNLMIHKLVEGNTPNQFRLFAGASVWAPGQLDSEINRDSWLVSSLPINVVFHNKGDKQWEHCIDLAGQALVSAWF
jgi:putative transcriptional regulator